MKFAPKTEAQLKAAMLLEPGDYPFEFTKAEDRVSKSGNDMIALELRVFVGADRSYRMKDWILPAFERKLRHFAYAVGLGKDYDTGAITAEQCVGRTGKCLVIQEIKEGFDPRNSIKDYIVAGDQPNGEITAKKPAIPAQADVDEPPF
jgi:hypothetical protein